MTHDELLKALTAERYDNRWWTTPTPKPTPEPPEAGEHRRNLALAEWAAHNPDKD